MDFSARVCTKGDDFIGNLHDFRSPQVRSDIADVHVGDTTLHLTVASASNDREPALSADDRRLAFSSDISGANEIYARSYIGDGAAILVSAHGG